MEITFLPQGIRQQFEEGKTVLELAAEAGISIDGNCAGAGTCGKCKVKLLEGNIGEPDDKEMAKLTELELQNGYRLACRYKPSTDLVVQVALVEETAKRKTKLIKLPDDFVPETNIKKLYIELAPPSLENQQADLERIRIACGLGSQIKTNTKLISSLPQILENEKEDNHFTVTLRDNELIHIEKGDLSQECYGIAYDIGTTTVVGHLWNLITGKLIGVNAAANPQGNYGADVISRIAFSGEKEGNLELLHKKIVDCLNQIAEDFTRSFNIKPENIYEFAIVGNTTMSHLLLGVDPERLAVSPFTPVFVNGIYDGGAAIGLKGNSQAKFYLLPNIAGHVGSDITADIMAMGIMNEENTALKDEVHLMIDIGTNGEIVLTGRGKTLACSTAAGPAFEGASIYQGMRAAEGAIEKVVMDEDVTLEVIGGKAPQGICGSGIIDVVAEMLKLGLVDKSGKFVKQEKLKEKGIPEAIVNRFRKGENGNEFVLAYNEDSEDVVILQKDIREVQLAKAAIRSGVVTMMKMMDITDEDLTHVHIAGAFGSYIDRESAVTIGLLPNISRDKIKFEGNTAGTGSCMALLSPKFRPLIEKNASIIQHVELSACDDFTDEYLKAMKF
ncbi:MAG: ASKHA domain-containing protein [Anaerovoracaceae bacterium]|jgi:uncharacterized 2Fe-2S/4Fe-4S cluster protein (DUF4445 family)